MWEDLGLGGVYVPNAIEQTPPTATPPTAGIPDDAPLLLAVGNMWPEKNQIGLLRALRAHPGDWQLALIGGPSPDHPHLPAEIARLAAEDPRVHLLGPRSPALPMERASMLLLPLVAEATPLVILEAMSRDSPRVATLTCGSVHDHAGGSHRSP